MRREHASILTEVLQELARYHEDRPHELHITVLAARVNLPHDRLKAYLAELSRAGLVWPDWPSNLTPRGDQFLQCYHAWLRLQAFFGLRPAGPEVRRAMRRDEAATVRLVRPDPAPTRGVMDAGTLARP